MFSTISNVSMFAHFMNKYDIEKGPFKGRDGWGVRGLSDGSGGNIVH